jgi:putative glutathione S-transferase
MSSSPTASPSFARETGDDGSFQRQDSAFRSHDVVPEAGRYHLYVSYACPWAHRSIIGRRLKGLEDAISMSVVDPVRDERGWAFTGGEFTDPVNGFSFLSEAYEATDPAFDARVTVPVLWDKETGTVVNNESGEVLRLLNSAFGDLADDAIDLYPEPLRDEIDAVNARVYDTVNNGVYKAGFTTSQEVYEREACALFDTLDWLEERLARRRYLVTDDVPTEVDWRLFTTLVRFDSVYVTHFKCNLRRLVDYPNLWGFTRDLYQSHGIADTVKLDQIKAHYYLTHPQINGNLLVPIGPALDLDAPHGRG